MDIVNHGDGSINLAIAPSTGTLYIKQSKIEAAGDRYRNIIPLFDVEALNEKYKQLENDNHVGYSFQLQNLMCSFHLPSFPLCAPPDINPEDSLAEKHIKIKDLEKNTPGLILTLGVSFWAGENLRRSCEKARIKLLNYGVETHIPLIYPYLSPGETKNFSRDDIITIGGMIESLGQSIQLTGNDYINISFDWVHSISLIPRPIDDIQRIINQAYVVNTTPQLIARSSPSRVLLWIQNDGDNRVFVQLVQSTEQFNIDTAMVIEPGGLWSYEASRYRLPQAVWAATAQGESYIRLMEGL